MNITEELIKEIRSANRVISIPMVPRGLSVTRIHQVSNKLLHKVLEMNGDIELLSGTNIICQPGDVLIDNHRTLWEVVASPVLAESVKKVYDKKIQMKDAANNIISDETLQDVDVDINGEYHVIIDSKNKLAYVANRFGDDILIQIPEFKVGKDWTYQVTPGKEQFVVANITNAYIAAHPGWSVTHPKDMMIIKRNGSNQKWTIMVDEKTGEATILELVEPPKKDIMQVIHDKPSLDKTKFVEFVGISSNTNDVFVTLKDGSIYGVKFESKYRIALGENHDKDVIAVINLYEGDSEVISSCVKITRYFYYCKSAYLIMPVITSVDSATRLVALNCDKTVITSVGRLKVTVYDYKKTLALTMSMSLVDVYLQNAVEVDKLHRIMVVQKNDQFYLIGLRYPTTNDIVKVSQVDDFLVETSYTTNDLMEASSISKLRYNYKDDVVYFEFGDNHVLLSINTPEWKKVFADGIDVGHAFIHASVRAEISSIKNPVVYTDMLAKRAMLMNYVVLTDTASNTFSNIFIRCIQPYVTLTEYVDEVFSFKAVCAAINEDRKTMVVMNLPNILVAVFDTAFIPDMSKIKQIKIVRATGRGKYYLIDNSDDISNSHIYLLEGKPKLFDVTDTKPFEVDMIAGENSEPAYTPNNVKDKEVIIGEDDGTPNHVKEPRPFIVTNDGRKLYIANIKQRRNTKTIYSLNGDRKSDITNIIDKNQLDEDQELGTTSNNASEQLPQDEVGKRGKFAEYIRDKFDKIN